MSYKYEDEKATLFTEQGQRLFLKVRDQAKQLLKIAGAARMNEMISNISGSGWQKMACVDRLVELGELLELEPEAGRWGQYRVFVEVTSNE